MIDNRMKRQIKQRTEESSVWIGKGGCTAQIMNEMSRQLNLHQVVKAKILQTALRDAETKKMATEVASQTGASLIEVRGHTFILYKPKKKAVK